MPPSNFLLPCFSPVLLCPAGRPGGAANRWLSGRFTPPTWPWPAALLVSSVIDFKTKEIYTVVTNGGMIVAVAACAIFPALNERVYRPALVSL